MRTSPTQLPSYTELCHILASEGVRSIPSEKENMHYGDFTSIVALLRAFNLPTTFFTEHVDFKMWEDTGFFEHTNTTLSALMDKVLEAQEDQSKIVLFNELYDYLSEEDVPEKADIIFVFGSKTTFRAEKAISLYEKGYAPKIVLSGRSPVYEEKPSISEAEALAEFVVSKGVPQDAIVTEKESISVPDNIKRSLTLLEKENIPHQKVILVNSPFSQRRGWAHFQKMSDEGTKLFRVNTDTVSEQFSRNGWYKNETGVKVIIKEFFGLRVSEMINTS
jgi:hypothetical protein